jgi:hypothetical protein
LSPAILVANKGPALFDVLFSAASPLAGSLTRLLDEKTADATVAGHYGPDSKQSVAIATQIPICRKTNNQLRQSRLYNITKPQKQPKHKAWQQRHNHCFSSAIYLTDWSEYGREHR